MEAARGKRREAVLTGEVGTTGPHLAARRYLRYDQRKGGPAGLLHCESNLRWLLIEAFATGRVALLPPLRLARRHNFGIDNAWRWETYIDLAHGRIVDLAHGAEHPLPLCDGIEAAGLRVLTLPARKPVPVSAAGVDLVVRQVGKLYRYAVPAKVREWAGLDGHPHPRLKVHIPTSAKVEALAAPVIEALGGPGRFAAVHVRRDDRLGSEIEEAMSPMGIRRRLRTLVLADGSRVFFLSDERDPAFWSELDPYYDAVHYTAFPSLTDLVSRTSGMRPDNYLLFAVEREVMRHATLRVKTFPVGLADAALLGEEAIFARRKRPAHPRGVPAVKTRRHRREDVPVEAEKRTERQGPRPRRRKSEGRGRARIGAFRATGRSARAGGTHMPEGRRR